MSDEPESPSWFCPAVGGEGFGLLGCASGAGTGASPPPTDPSTSGACFTSADSSSLCTSWKPSVDRRVAVTHSQWANTATHTPLVYALSETPNNSVGICVQITATVTAHHKRGGAPPPRHSRKHDVTVPHQHDRYIIRTWRWYTATNDGNAKRVGATPPRMKAISDVAVVAKNKCH